MRTWAEAEVRRVTVDAGEAAVVRVYDDDEGLALALAAEEDVVEAVADVLAAKSMEREASRRRGSTLFVVRFVCGVILHRARGPLAKGRWSWPFGGVDLGEEEVVAYSPLLGERGAVHVQYREITQAAVKRVLGGGKVWLRRRSPDDGDITIVTLGDAYTRVADLLREKQVEVVEGSLVAKAVDPNRGRRGSGIRRHGWQGRCDRASAEETIA